MRGEALFRRWAIAVAVVFALPSVGCDSGGTREAPDTGENATADDIDDGSEGDDTTGAIDADGSDTRVVDADDGGTAVDGSDTGPTDTARDVEDGADADTRPRPSPAFGLADQDILDRVYRPKAIPKSYEKQLSPPACNAGNSSVLILEPGDDLEAAFNRDDKRIFCLTPGDYSDQFADITTSGTEQKPRWIRYYNPNGSSAEHPWDMADPETRGAADRVIIGGIYMRPGAWWRIDRIRFARRLQIIESEHVIANRLMFYKNPVDVQIVIKRSSDVTVQNSLMGKTEFDDRGGSCDTDANGVAIQGDSEDIHVVGNEIFDFWCGDGVQTLKIDKFCRGFVVQDNDIYTTPEFNSEGFPVENGIDFKCGPADTSTGSTDGIEAEDWVLIEGNRLWGSGSELLFHYPAVSGVVVRQNFLWDLGEFAWQISAKDEINREHHVYDNVIFETGGGFKPRHIDASFFARNVFVRAQGEDRAWAWFANPEDNEVRRNVFVETDVPVPCLTDQGNAVESNAFYGAEPFDCSASGRIEKDSASAANHGDYTLQIKSITGPETKTLPGTRPTSTSPHSTWFPEARSR